MFKLSFLLSNVLCFLLLFPAIHMQARPSDPLPVPSLTVSVEGSNVELEWRLKSLIHAGNFELERSLNGTDFISLTKKYATEKRDYAVIFSFIDKAVLSIGLPKYFYRLKHTSVDGVIRYSTVQEVNTSSQRRELSVVGHSMVQQYKYIVHFKGHGNVQMNVVNMLGEVKFKQLYPKLKGPKTMYLFTENWESGAYIIDLKQGQFKARYKFVLP